MLDPSPGSIMLQEATDGSTALQDSIPEKQQQLTKLANGNAVGLMEKRSLGTDFPSAVECFNAYPWQDTVVGSPQTWTPEMLAALRIVHSTEVAAALYLDSKAMHICWNDQYAATITRSKHPSQYAWHAPTVFKEIEPLQDIIDAVFRDKKAYTATGFVAYLDRTTRTGFKEESFFDFTLGPLVNADGVCWGILNFALDVTQSNLLSRRTELLNRLSTRGARAQSVEGVCHSYVAATRDSIDLPWIAVYVAAELTDAKADKDLISELGGGAQKSRASHSRGSKTT